MTIISFKQNGSEQFLFQQRFFHISEIVLADYTRKLLFYIGFSLTTM